MYCGGSGVPNVAGWSQHFLCNLNEVSNWLQGGVIGVYLLFQTHYLKIFGNVSRKNAPLLPTTMYCGGSGVPNVAGLIPNTFSATWMRCQTGFREVWLGYICHFRHIISKYLGMCRGKMHHCFLRQCTVEVVEYQMWLDDPNTFSATWMRCQTGFREVWLGYICHFRHIISKYLGMCRGKMHHCFLPQCTMFSGQNMVNSISNMCIMGILRRRTWKQYNADPLFSVSRNKEMEVRY